MREKLNLNGLRLSVQSPFVSCHLPGVTFTAVFCVAQGLASGSLQSQHGALHLRGISQSSWRGARQPVPQDRETLLIFLTSFLFAL